MKNTIARGINKMRNKLCGIPIVFGVFVAFSSSHCIAESSHLTPPAEPEFLSKEFKHEEWNCTGEVCELLVIHEGALALGEAKEVSIYAITNKVGSVLKMSNLGCAVMSLTMPDAAGVFENVLLEFEKPEDHVKDGQISTICGRVANRISDGKFTLDGYEYNTTLNFGWAKKATLHGGTFGFDKKKWHLLDKTKFPYNDNQLVFYYISPDGEEGFPGNLLTFAAYSLTDEQELVVEFYAFSDKTTICNLTQHFYFNLGGIKEGRTANNIEDTLVQLKCDRVMEVEAKGIPTGKLLPVAGTDLDFRSGFRPISQASKSEAEQIQFNYGLNHCFFVEPEQPYEGNNTMPLCYFNRDNPSLRVVARAKDVYNGRQLEIATDQQTIVFYAGNFVNKKLGTKGCNYEPRTAFCLETQAPIDVQRLPHLGTSRLAPFQRYTNKTIFKFSVSGSEYNREYVEEAKKKQQAK